MTGCSTILHWVEEIVSERRRPGVEAGRVLHGQGSLAVVGNLLRSRGGDGCLCHIIESGRWLIGANKRRCCRGSKHLL